MKNSKTLGSEQHQYRINKIWERKSCEYLILIKCVQERKIPETWYSSDTQDKKGDN